MMRTAKTWIWEEMGVEMPQGTINGEWFCRKSFADDRGVQLLWYHYGTAECDD